MFHRKTRIAGETYFFTVHCGPGNPSLVDCIIALREAMRPVKTRLPFHINALVVLPDHLHAVWTLPEKDEDYLSRWTLIRDFYSRQAPLVRNGSCDSEIWRGSIRDFHIENLVDLEKCIAYTHYDPVRHGHVKQPADWLYSSIHRYISEGIISPDWTPDKVMIQGSGFRIQEF